MHRHRLLLQLLLMMWSIHWIHTLGAYDCEHRLAKFVEINLLQPEECPTTPKDYQQPVEMRVQVLHVDSVIRIKAYTCKIIVTKRVHRCGYDSLNYGHTFSAYKEIYEITPEECRKAVRTKEVTVLKRKIAIHIGLRIAAQFFTYGSRDRDGNCRHTTFTSGGTTYVKSYEQAMVEILVQEIRGTVHYQYNEVHFDTLGIVSPLHDRVSRDSREGIIVWEPPTIECDNTVSEIYKGKATIRRQPKEPGYENAILMIENKGTNQYAGLVLKGTLPICDKMMYATHLGKGLAVYIMPPEADQSGVHVPIVGKQFDVETRNIQTQISYLHLDLKITFHNHWDDFREELCGLDYRTLHTRLQAISDTNNPYSLRDIFGDGHSIKRAGAVAYVTKCIPVEVDISSFPNCTQEIPIKYRNTTQFADPITRIIKTFPQIIPCDPIHPVKWQIDGRWKDSLPGTSNSDPPRQLNLTFGLIDYPGRFIDGVGRGLYTDEQMEAHRIFIDSLDTRPAVMNKVTNAAVLNAREGGYLGMTLSTDELTDLSGYVQWHIFPLAYWLGDAWHYVSTLILFLGIVKIVISNLWKMIRIYKVKGCGWWMVASLFVTGTLIITYPIEIVMKAWEALQAPSAPLPAEDPNKEMLNAKEMEVLREENSSNQKIINELREEMALMRQAQSNINRNYDRLLVAKCLDSAHLDPVDSDHTHYATLDHSNTTSSLAPPDSAHCGVYPTFPKSNP